MKRLTTLALSTLALFLTQTTQALAGSPPASYPQLLTPGQTLIRADVSSLAPSDGERAGVRAGLAGSADLVASDASSLAPPGAAARLCGESDAQNAATSGGIASAADVAESDDAADLAPSDGDSGGARSRQAHSSDLVRTARDPFLVAQDQLPGAGTAYSAGFSYGGQGAGPAANSLVVFSSDHEAKAQSNLQEDLAVMSHILDKATQQKASGDRFRTTAMGISVLFAPGSSPFRSLYLEGYGALFTLQVDFPLLPPPANTQAPKEKTPVDSTWDEARQELYGHGPQPRENNEPAERYSAEQVDSLKTALLEALKNATNIRDLKPDESVTVCVFGSGNRGGALAGARAGGGPTLGDAPNVYWFDSHGSHRRATVLAIRARKSDIDALAKGDLTPEDFRKRVSTTSYVGSVREGDTFGTYSVGGGGGFYGGSSVNLLGPDSTDQKK